MTFRFCSLAVRPACRPARRGLLALVWLGLLAGSVAAQSTDRKPEPPVVVIVKGSESPETLQKLIDGARKTGREVRIQLAEPPEPAKPAEKPAAPADQNLFAAGLGLFQAGMKLGIQTIPAMPRLIQELASGLGESAAQYGAFSLLLRLLAAIGLPLLLFFTVRNLVGRALPAPPASPDADLAERFRVSGLRLIADLSGFFAMIAAISPLVEALLPQHGFANHAALAASRAIPQAIAYWIAGRFLLAPGDPNTRLLPLPHADWNHRMLVNYGMAGALILFIVDVGYKVVKDPAGVSGWFFVLGTAIVAFKVWWFWKAWPDIAMLIRHGGADPANPPFARRFAAQVFPRFLIASAVIIWVIGRMAAVLPEGAWWGWVSAITQILIVTLPIAAEGAIHLVDALKRRTERALGGEPPTPLVVALWAVARRAAALGFWLVGLGILGRMWAGALINMEAEAIASGLRTMMGAAAVIVAGILVFTFVKAMLDAVAPARLAHMPGEDDEAEAGKPHSRLATVLPVLRGFVLGGVIGLTLLLALSRLGLDIGPLLAGFGILGLAISFGSQALVRDIVSGIFFMAEDAFRVGEYIDTGKLKGTVERISIRSVRLRHQSGQIHTIPFGQIASVTNASRDWATVKFPLRLDRTADIEKARKLVKKVGQDLQADAELGPDFVLPVKLQGIQEIQDSAVVVRIKFTAKPIRASLLQREALKRIYRALNEAGVPLASNAVTVRSSEERVAAAAAAQASVAPLPQPAAAG